MKKFCLLLAGGLNKLLSIFKLLRFRGQIDGVLGFWGFGVYLVLFLGQNSNPVLSAFAMTATGAPDRKLDHLGVGEQVQALHADA